MINDSSWDRMARNTHAAHRLTSTQPAGAACTATREAVNQLSQTCEAIVRLLLESSFALIHSVFSFKVEFDKERLFNVQHLLIQAKKKHSEILDWTHIHIDAPDRWMDG